MRHCRFVRREKGLYLDQVIPSRLGVLLEELSLVWTRVSFAPSFNQFVPDTLFRGTFQHLSR